jgi:glutamate-1-semialdehyde 2,1-aminomutase
MPGADPPYDGAPVPGIPAEVHGSTVIIPPNDLGAVERTLTADPQIGCVILEPTGGHWGAVPIRGPFLKGLRELTTRLGRLLIFDEVITGFRVSPGGAQAYYDVTPDLTTLAKILAGGLPGGCVAGRADLVGLIELRPGKPKMRHPGTFNANPLSAVAGVATLELVATGEPNRQANETAWQLRHELNDLFTRRGDHWAAYGEFSGWRLLPGYDGPRPTADDWVPYEGDLVRLDGPKDRRLVQAFRQGMLLHGVDAWGPSGMTTSAHTWADVEQTVAAVASTLDLLRAEGLT